MPIGPATERERIMQGMLFKAIVSDERERERERENWIHRNNSGIRTQDLQKSDALTTGPMAEQGRIQDLWKGGAPYMKRCRR